MKEALNLKLPQGEEYKLPFLEESKTTRTISINPKFTQRLASCLLIKQGISRERERERERETRASSSSSSWRTVKILSEELRILIEEERLVFSVSHTHEAKSSMAEDSPPLPAIDLFLRPAYPRLESAPEHHSRWSASSPLSFRFLFVGENRSKSYPTLNQMRWVWIFEEQEYIIDDSCQINFRVENISYPPVPTERAEDAKYMVITGTIDDDGLGPVSWWEGCSERNNEDDDDT
ncbi:hypothetical protein F2Q70_00042024 [Brassica cretica]|uniref:RNA polymerase III subunit Rpc25 domain-containing protein n=1 Tax=Brassica cretica TaxID=69181 RepID=A0A8S9K9N8_BRACR|nr:hypothetical protein F2Q70_00042024 [Brassica cretica]